MTLLFMSKGFIMDSKIESNFIDLYWCYSLGHDYFILFTDAVIAILMGPKLNS